MRVTQAIGRLMVVGSIITSSALGVAQQPTIAASACSAISFSQPGGGSNYVPAGASMGDPSLDVTGYSLSGSGGQATVTMTIGAAPTLIPGSDGTTYSVMWDTGTTSYFARMVYTVFPSTPATSQYTYLVGALDKTLPVSRYLADTSIPVKGSVSGTTITMTFPYGPQSGPSVLPTATGGYSAVIRSLPYFVVNGGPDPLPTHGLSSQTDSAPEGGTSGTADGGAGGAPFC